MYRAITSLPTPLSPVTSTLASPAADRRAIESTSSMAALPATITGSPSVFGRAELITEVASLIENPAPSELIGKNGEFLSAREQNRN